MHDEEEEVEEEEEDDSCEVTCDAAFVKWTTYCCTPVVDALRYNTACEPICPANKPLVVNNTCTAASASAALVFSLALFCLLLLCRPKRAPSFMTSNNKKQYYICNTCVSNSFFV